MFITPLVQSKGRKLVMNTHTPTFGAFIITALLALLSLTFIYQYITKHKFEQSDKDKFSAPIFILVLVGMLCGGLIATSPAVHPYSMEFWAWCGLSTTTINPISPPIAGQDFSYDPTKTTVKFIKTPPNVQWVVARHDHKPFFTNEDTYVVPAGVDPKEIELFFQHRYDGRTSSSIPITN